ncbi:ABC transporter substrate-binding protein [Agromyces bauzanensis]
MTIAVATTIALATAGCADLAEPDNPYGEADQELQAASFDAATEIADGEKIGGTVSVLGVLGGNEQEAFLSQFAPFEEATGITVEYEGTRDILSLLQTRVDGGNPPDVVANPSIGQMRTLIEDGDLVALDDILDVSALSEQYDQGLLDLGSDDDGTLYGLFNTASVKGLVYYDPKNYTGPTAPADWAELADYTDKLAASGSTPWCIGVENGAATGWMATDWIEQFFLKGQSLDDWDAWWRGELPWTSDQVKEAFKQFGAIATDPAQVNGGPTAVVSTDFFAAALPMYGDPASCQVTLQADWLATTLPTQVDGVTFPDSIDYFPFPAVEADGEGRVEIGGELLGAFNDTPQVEAFLKYAATPERHALVAASGLWISPNKAVPTDLYPSESGQRAAEILSSASALRFDASDLLPSDVLQAYWAAVLNYITDPSTLDAGLGSIEAVRLSHK